LIPAPAPPSVLTASGLCASPQGPLVTFAPDQAHKPLDRNAQVALHYSAEWVRELRDLGLNASQKIEEVENESSSGGKFTTKGLRTSILVNGTSHNISGIFERGSFGTVSKDSLFFTGVGTTMLSAMGSSMLVLSLGFGGVMAGLVLSPVLGAGAALGYALCKTGSLRDGWNMMRDCFARRPLSYDKRQDLVKSVFDQLSREAGCDTTITLHPQRKNALLKDLTAYAATKGYTVRAVLPNGEISASEARRIVNAPTLGEVVAELAPVEPIPTLPKPDETQKDWTDKLSVAFNRLSSAIKQMDSTLQAAAKPMIDEVGRLQVLCAETRVQNTRIGRVAHELDNLSVQVESYAMLTRLNMAGDGEREGLAGVFATKAESLRERFEADYKELRVRFQVHQKLLQQDLI
jgi:hypothetical protein